MIIIGIDPSLNSLGAAVIGKKVSSCVIRPEGEDLYQKLSEQYRGLAGVVKHVSSVRTGSEPVVCAVEGYSYGHAGKSRAMSVLAEVVGMVKTVSIEQGWLGVTVANQTWRSVTMGRRLTGASKRTKGDREAYCRAISEVWDYRFRTTDEADAYLIAKTVELIVTGRAVPSDGVRNIIEDLARVGVTCGRMQKDLFTEER